MSAMKPLLVDTYLSMNDHCFPRNSAWKILVEEMVKTLLQAMVTAVPVSVLPTEDLAVLSSYVVLLFDLVQLDNSCRFPSPLCIASVVPSSHFSKAPLIPHPALLAGDKLSKHWVDAPAERPSDLGTFLIHQSHAFQ